MNYGLRSMLRALVTRCTLYHRNTTEKDDVPDPPREKSRSGSNTEPTRFSIDLGPLRAAVSGGPMVVSVVSITLLLLVFGPQWL